ncbi:MAG: hypothetical protein HC920_16465 [Oscillatoriales cyanobacterium SM2_3_0]|nr:hypothetical protein [Oscillatoriales cyanobacterium SM2_3_0]
MESQALCQLRDERKQMVQPTMQAYQALGEMTTQDADVHRAHYNLKTTEARNALKPAQTQAKFQLIGLEAIRS